MKELFVNTLTEMKAARAEVRGTLNEVVPMLRIDLWAERQDLTGRHPPFALPSLWLETREVLALIQALQLSLAKHIPESQTESSATADPSESTPPHRH